VVILIVIIEGIVAFTATRVAWRLRRSGRFALFLCGILLGMAWCPFLHGVFFGVLEVEGHHADPDLGLLLGFGLVAALLPGIPLGAVLSLALVAASRLGQWRRAIRARRSC
jgi:hypothetical protein